MSLQAKWNNYNSYNIVVILFYIVNLDINILFRMYDKEITNKSIFTESQYIN